MGANKIGEKGAEHIAEALSKLMQLSQLNLNLGDTELKSEGLQKISAGLSQLVYLQYLSLRLNNNQIGDIGVKHLSAALSQLTGLQNLSLNLASNKITDNGMKRLGLVLLKLKQLKSLSLDLSNNQIEDKGAECLGTALSRLTQLSELKINLVEYLNFDPMLEVDIDLQKADNTLSLKVVKTSEFFLKQIMIWLSGLTYLRELNLYLDFNQIQDKGAKCLGTALSRLTQLSELKINLVENENKLAVEIEMLKADNRCKLRFVKTSEEVVKQFMCWLSGLTYLRELELDFSQNKIGDKGAEHMAAAISKLTQLTQLDIHLDQNNIGNKGAEAVAAAISKLTQLTYLWIDFNSNNMGDKGAGAVAAAISKLTQLTQLTLWLKGTKLQNGEKAKQILEKKFAHLKELNILV